MRYWTAAQLQPGRQALALHMPAQDAQAARAAHCGHREDSEIPLFPDYAFVCRPLVPWRGAIDNGRRSTGEGFRPAIGEIRGHEREGAIGLRRRLLNGRVRLCSRVSPRKHVTITPV